MTPLLDLHIFTNATASAPSTLMIEETYASFRDRFSVDLSVTVWCDEHPFVEVASDYRINLARMFPRVVPTQSLSDGYVQAVRTSQADYMFMLEHDWEFLPTITHGLEDIVNLMRDQGLLHLRFNKRTNVAKKSDRDLQPVTHAAIPYCTTGFLSNNPHIIDREQYIQRALPFITVREKSFGIEKDVSLAKLTGAIYGGLDHPAAVRHTDGKNYRI